uniref:Gustatory receptor n=1 Tax=Cacopsylla melanoneura TaxID=428564 RepID=A0A8D8QDN3_9HEMI
MILSLSFTGLHNRSLNKLNFSWCSLVTIYSLCLLAGFLTIEMFSLDYTIRNLNEDSLTAKGGIKRATSGSIFYGNACIAMILFIRLARQWPQLVRDWKMVELAMARFGTPRLGWRFSVMSTVLFTLAFLEHGLHNWLNTRPGGKDDITAMSTSQSGVTATPGGPVNYSIDNSLTFAGYLERFSLKTHWFLFQEQTITSYNSVIGFMIMWLALSATFLWNFTDLFIMLISAALAAQLRMFTTGLTAARGQLFTNNEWREYREAYTLLSLLVKKVDSHINSIIMLSVSSNVYFICAQLITEIDSIKHSYFRTLFYMYSSLFLVFRTTVVVMQAAAINDETKRIPPELYLCPQQSYCVETQRFLHEVTSDFVALTGLNMFYITRNFLLGWCIPGYSCLLNPNILVSEYGTTVSWSFVDSICLNVFNRNENCHRL